MPTYAASTDVSSDKSRAEIERTLQRFGATTFMYGWQAESAVIAFVHRGKQIRMTLPLPDRQDKQFTLTPTGKWKRSQAEAEKAYEQAVRQRWRALALIVKAKLEGVEAGVTSFEQEWGMFVVLPSGKTVADEVIPAIEHAYLTGSVAPLLQIEGS